MLQLERVQGISLAEHNHVIYILPSSLAVINKLNAFLNEARARKVRNTICFSTLSRFLEELELYYFDFDPEVRCL